nr:dihydroneopterin aldolase [Aquincola tertiaricarbonis]
MIPQPSPATPSAAPLRAPARMDIIFIEGFTGHTVIGIHETELHHAQPLVIDLQAGVPRARACDTDRIGDTIDYSVVRERLQQLMAHHKLQLLEAFAEAIADMLLVDFGARWVRVKVAKPRKFDDVQAVGVQIERDATDVAPATREAGRQAAVVQLLGSGLVPGRRD